MLGVIEEEEETVYLAQCRFIRTFDKKMSHWTTIFTFLESTEIIEAMEDIMSSQNETYTD